MSRRKAPSKVAVHRAAKVLSNPKSSKSAKSSAAKILGKAYTPTRTVKRAAKSGSVSRSDARSAISRVKKK